jgi:tRNA uridine 5-carboxymethylaminomethyl modification enzyme
MKDYDVIVIGGGHAGIEASLAAARLGCRTLLITQNPDRIGALSCNPAVGGLSKGNLVREVDALGGEMGHLIDATMIQYRVLNQSRGAAVQAPRAQADKAAYQGAARKALEGQAGLEIFMDTVIDFITTDTPPLAPPASGRGKNNPPPPCGGDRGGGIVGVKTQRGHEFGAKAVVLTTGTFMEGKIFIGEYEAREGRLGEEAALGLGDALRRRGFPVGRLKTGTPARLAGNTVNYDKMQRQDGEPFEPFSFDVGTDNNAGADNGVGADNYPPLRRGGFETHPYPHTPCYITYTNPHTHDIIRANIHRSPLYGGKIVGVGPRYCPSIEDKVMRFPNRERHQLFIEPEGLYTNEVYMNGASSSLPEDVQAEVIHSIAGLEEARIVRPAYAVEYDYLDPQALFPSLESKLLQGLFVAGQTNGSSGYEEAAAQGLIAGINAALYSRWSSLSRPRSDYQPLILGRHEAYIGVLIDDLTTLGTKEPYRMFTSRAEHRLLLRHDSADRRLTPKGHAVGLIDEGRWERFCKKVEGIEAVKELLRNRVGALRATPLGRDTVNRVSTSYPDEWIRQAELDLHYAGYIEKENRIVARNAKMENIKLAGNTDYKAIKGLSAEAAEKLQKVQPQTVGQAARIPGIRQGDIALLIVLAGKK